MAKSGRGSKDDANLDINPSGEVRPSVLSGSARRENMTTQSFRERRDYFGGSQRKGLGPTEAQSGRASPTRAGLNGNQHRKES